MRSWFGWSGGIGRIARLKGWEEDRPALRAAVGWTGGAGMRSRRT